MSHGGEGNTRVVVAALAGNALIALGKFVAAYFSESTAMLAEAVHSVADMGNQVLLLVGLRMALRPADERHPFGRSGEQYFWPFIVSLLLFSMGGLFALYEGVERIRHGGHVASGRQLAWAYGVLGLSIALELYSFTVAAREFRSLRRGRPIREVLTEGKDVTVPLVLMEDTAALAGLFVALVGIVTAQLTGATWVDGVASLGIGLILCTVAVFLAYETHGLLIGEAASREDRACASRIVTGVPGVERLVELLTLHLGPTDVILALKVAFDPRMSLREVEATINEIERRVRGEMPYMKRIFVEPDSEGGFTEGRPPAREAEPPRAGAA